MTGQHAPGVDRSPRWPAARRAHLKREPRCLACGTPLHLEVHHERPYHLWPELELAGSNLMTLCQTPGRNCHLVVGHLLSWEAYNPAARADAATYMAKVAGRPTTRDGWPLP